MSLKEIKARIASVRNTRKITSAMKMVSSVKLRKAQQAAMSAVPYVEQLDNIMVHLMQTPSVCDNVLLTGHDSVKSAAIVAFSSDSSLCGGFNSNIIKASLKTADALSREGLDITVYTVGQKVTDAFAKTSYRVCTDYKDLIEKREYSTAAKLCDTLVGMYQEGTTDKVILVYTHFKSAGSQQIVNETLLPIPAKTSTEESVMGTDFILEPSADELMETLLPKVLRMKVHTAVLDSYASEQAARVMAMQMATDNADKLAGELTMQYNKQRQQAITNELLDLAGGSQNQ